MSVACARVACACVPGSALRARGVEILGSILAFQSNGLFIGQTNRVRASEGGGKASTACGLLLLASRNVPVAVVIRMVRKGCSHSVFVLVAVIGLYGYSHRHARFWESC